MIAACQAAELRATSHGSRSAETMLAGSERAAGVAKARAAPNKRTIRKIGVTEVGLVPAYQANTPATTISPRAPAATTLRRSTRSATAAVSRARSAAEANSAK